MNEEVEVSWAKVTREYFERGCRCINVTKSVEILGEDVDDKHAVQFYEEACICSRNYKNSGDSDE